VDVTKGRIGKAGIGKVAFLPILFIMLFCWAAFADEIIMRNGRTVSNAKVLQVNIGDIEYQIGEREVIYTARKSDVAKIIYKDGTEDIFEVTAAPVKPAKDEDVTSIAQPQIAAPPPPPDCDRMYEGKCLRYIGDHNKFYNNRLLAEEEIEVLKELDPNLHYFTELAEYYRSASFLFWTWKRRLTSFRIMMYVEKR
jgi:hypothetical protein